MHGAKKEGAVALIESFSPIFFISFLFICHQLLLKIDGLPASLALIIFI